MKLVGYVRVSTDRQHEQGHGPEVQREALRKWAKTHGHRLIAFAEDLGVSGSNGLDARDGLLEALTMIRRGEAGGVAVYRLDRLARDLIAQETLLAEVRRLGGIVFSASGAEAGFLNDDPDDPSRKLIRQVLGAVNEYDRGMIVLRLRAGRQQKARMGGYAYGAPHFGVRAESKALVRDEDEAVVVDRVAQLHASGLSLREIGRTLHAEGRRSKRGSVMWPPTTIARILSRLEQKV